MLDIIQPFKMPPTSFTSVAPALCVLPIVAAGMPSPSLNQRTRHIGRRTLASHGKSLIGLGGRVLDDWKHQVAAGSWVWYYSTNSEL